MIWPLPHFLKCLPLFPCVLSPSYAGQTCQVCIASGVLCLLIFSPRYCLHTLDCLILLLVRFGHKCLLLDLVSYSSSLISLLCLFSPSGSTTMCHHLIGELALLFTLCTTCLPLWEHKLYELTPLQVSPASRTVPGLGDAHRMLYLLNE